MNSIIFTVAVRMLRPLFVLVGVIMLLRGQDLPGGGFIGGLLVAAAFAFTILARGPAAVRERQRFPPRIYAGGGLALALTSGAVPMLAGKPFLTGLWHDLSLGVATLPLGTPFFFDLGVLLTVFGAVSAILLALSEEEE